MPFRWNIIKVARKEKHFQSVMFIWIFVSNIFTKTKISWSIFNSDCIVSRVTIDFIDMELKAPAWIRLGHSENITRTLYLLRFIRSNEYAIWRWPIRIRPSGKLVTLVKLYGLYKSYLSIIVLTRHHNLNKLISQRLKIIFKMKGESWIMHRRNVTSSCPIKCKLIWSLGVPSDLLIVKNNLSRWHHSFLK